MENEVWLIGAGGMAEDYIKVLKNLNVKYKVIGNSKKRAEDFERNTGVKAISGSIESFLKSKPKLCTHAIIAVGVDKLYEVTKVLLNYGVKNIMVEKPGALYDWQFKDLKLLKEETNSNIVIAYNRRFYTSVIKSQELIQEDGGLLSFNFEFTEWSHVIENLPTDDIIKSKWFLCNSSHVVDLAFYIGGKPEHITCFTSGGINWHPKSSIFTGSGKSVNGALFNYFANWESAGRWSLELLTEHRKIILKPLEQIQIQKKGSVNIEIYSGLNSTLDTDYKPGLYLQTNNFVNSTFDGMCTILEQAEMIEIYNKIANY